jgi:hypothetical protein
MTTYFGDFPVEMPHSAEHLTLVFSSATIPLKERWKNNGLSADFLADYFANFFPGDETPTQTSTRSEIKSTINYIANELLENALKFNYETDYNISIRLELLSDRIIFILSNSIDPATIEPFQKYLQYLIEADPQEEYFRKLEENALAEEGAASGLGFLTMLNDYGARLGWRFDTTELEGKPAVVIVRTLVQVGI